MWRTHAAVMKYHLHNRLAYLSISKWGLTSWMSCLLCFVTFPNVSWSTSEIRARLAPWNWFKPSSKIFLLTVPRRYFICGSFVLFMFCVVILSCLFMLPCGHLHGKGWSVGSCLWYLIVFLSLSHVVSWVRCSTLPVVNGECWHFVRSLLFLLKTWFSGIVYKWIENGIVNCGVIFCILKGHVREVNIFLWFLCICICWAPYCEHW